VISKHYTLISRISANPLSLIADLPMKDHHELLKNHKPRPPAYRLGGLRTFTARVRSDRPLVHEVPRISISDLKQWGLLQVGQTNRRDFDGYSLTNRRQANIPGTPDGG
jgi:hypothetical protein